MSDINVEPYRSRLDCIGVHDWPMESISVIKLTNAPFAFSPISFSPSDRVPACREWSRTLSRGHPEEASMAENSVWLATVSVIFLLSVYGVASYAAIPWV